MRVEYHLDSSDRIVYVNDDWKSFALENHGEHLAHDSILGQSVWQHIADASTSSIYERLYQRLRAGKHDASFTFRCDSAATRRLYRMHLRPAADGGIAVHVVEEQVTPREPIPLFDPDAERSSALVRMCAWCHAIADEAGGWVALETAVHDMRVFHPPKPPRVTHTVCPACLERVEREMETEEASSSS